MCNEDFARFIRFANYKRLMGIPSIEENATEVERSGKGRSFCFHTKQVASWFCLYLVGKEVVITLEPRHHKKIWIKKDGVSIVDYDEGKYLLKEFPIFSYDMFCDELNPTEQEIDLTRMCFEVNKYPAIRELIYPAEELVNDFISKDSFYLLKKEDLFDKEIIMRYVK